MKEWWDTLQSRERMLVTMAAAFVGFVIAYFAIWSPIAESREQRKVRVENKHETLAWMKQKKLEVEQLKRINPNLFNQATDTRSLLAIVDAGAKQMGIRPAIKRIEPSGENKVQVWLEDMSFDFLIVLLGELNRRNHIQIADASFDKSDQIGKVSGKVTLTR